MDSLAYGLLSASPAQPHMDPCRHARMCPTPKQTRREIGRFGLVVIEITIAVAVLALTSCAGSSADGGTASTCSAIVGGHPDARYEAVAALQDAFGTTHCTATLVGFSAGQSVLLTAAHCLDAPIARAVFGEDLLESQQEYEIAVPVPHPDFDKSTGEFDFAVVVVHGRVAARPLPVMSLDQDTLAPGSVVEFVGYGDTETSEQRQERNAVNGSIRTLSATSFAYDQALGGPCLADSGGPALALYEGEPLVAGVTSYGEGGCWGWGVSGRTSVARSFLDPLLDRADSCAQPRE